MLNSVCPGNSISSRAWSIVFLRKRAGVFWVICSLSAMEVICSSEDISVVLLSREGFVTYREISNQHFREPRSLIA
jgi:hypothetical protein